MKEETEKLGISSQPCGNNFNQSVEGQMAAFPKRDFNYRASTNTPKMNVTEVQSDVWPNSQESKNSRYSKTVQVFQQTGLLDCTLQTAKLCKENESLQERINQLEKQVNEAREKAKNDLKKRLNKEGNEN